MEAMDDMPELIDVDLPAELPSLIDQNKDDGVDEDGFKKVTRKRKPATKDVEMEDQTEGTEGAEGAEGAEGTSDKADRPRHAKRSKGVRGEMRRVPVPKHRYGALKNAWREILTPIVKNLGLQVRFNLRSRNVELRNPEDREDTTDLQKAADFVKAVVLGFDVNDALALIRLDHLFLETFEIADVKSSLKGDHLSRAVGRIAGKDGRTKLVIENVTKTRMVLADTKIHLLGAFNNLKLARNAISSLILGSTPSKVYGSLRNIASRANDRL
ncbi:unnamed protein product [Auanema sp. JU1783]|nr:unnamed protein product [Auanema sp. JU1783]